MALAVSNAKAAEAAKAVKAVKASKTAKAVNDAKDEKDVKDSLKYSVSGHAVGDSVYYRYCAGAGVEHVQARVVGVRGNRYRLRLVGVGSGVISARAEDVVKSDRKFL